MFIGISTITRGQTPAKSSLWSHEIYQTRCRRNRCQGAQHLGLWTRSWDLGKASTQFLWQFLDDKKKLPYLFHGVKKTINEWQIYSTHIWKRKFCKYDDKNDRILRGILRGIWMGGFGDNPKCDHGSKPWESHPPLKIRPRSRCEAKVSRDIHRQSSGDA